MTEVQFSFFSAITQCFRRTKEQRKFEQKLYLKGLKEEESIIIKKINKRIISKEFAMKFILEELNFAEQSNTVFQSFAKKSGFHVSEYLGEIKKSEEEREELEKIQSFFLNFLDKISNEKIMTETGIAILTGVMKHWEIGKYDDERKVLIEEEGFKEERLMEKENNRDFSKLAKDDFTFVSFENKLSSFKEFYKKFNDSFTLYIKELKTFLMKTLEYANTKIQKVLDTFGNPTTENKGKEEKDLVEVKAPKILTIYTEERVEALMEEYSHVIEEVITGKVNPDNSIEVKAFQEQISLAALEGNNIAFVFCAFFKLEALFPTLPFSINKMDNKSKIFFIEILNTFQNKGFSEELHTYLEENRENVYALATEDDKYMQYLIAFWYVWDNEDQEKVREEQYFWYNQSALNGFKPAIDKLESSNNHTKKS